MRVVAVHDATGRIVSLLTGPPEGPRVGVELKPGQYVHEVDVPEFSLDADDLELHRHLNGIMENFRVEVPVEINDVPMAHLVERRSYQGDRKERE